MERDFSNFGVPPQPPLYLLEVDERELDLLRMSVKGLYSYFFVRKEFLDSSKPDFRNELILSELKDLYWKIYHVY